MRPHKSINSERIAQAEASLDEPGFCLACGKEVEGCDRDCEKGECERCGEAAVYGVDMTIMMLGRERLKAMAEALKLKPDCLN
jgi:hypothetical protein